MGKPVRKRFDLQVTAEGQTVTQTFLLDKTIRSINGLQMSSNRDDLMYYRGSQRIEINGEEFFPEKYETKMLMSGINLTPKERFYNMGAIPTGNGSIKLTYKDDDSRLATFEPYRVSIYILGEVAE